MPSKTRAQDGAGTSRGRESTPNPPPVPPTLADAIAVLVNATADNTRFLREMAGQQFQQPGGRGYQQGPRETTYLDFSETRCWGPSASEGPQKQDLTVFLEYNV
jgi:hypothetical protein